MKQEFFFHVVFEVWHKGSAVNKESFYETRIIDMSQGDNYLKAFEDWIDAVGQRVPIGGTEAGSYNTVLVYANAIPGGKIVEKGPGVRVAN